MKEASTNLVSQVFESFLLCGSDRKGCFNDLLTKYGPFLQTVLAKINKKGPRGTNLRGENMF